MQPAYEIPQFTTTAPALASDLEADLVAVPSLQDQRPAPAWLDQATGGELAAAIERGEFTGKPSEHVDRRDRRRLAHASRRGGRRRPVGGSRRRELRAASAASVGLTARQQKRDALAFVLDERGPAR